jgi:hypothetical protein
MCNQGTNQKLKVRLAVFLLVCFSFFQSQKNAALPSSKIDEIVVEPDGRIGKVGSFNLQPSIGSDRTILYLHVGKTGGATLDRILRASCEWHKSQGSKRKCYQGLIGIEPVISHLTRRTIHVNLQPGDRQFARDNATTFLFTVRNPIARAVSAFNMLHLTNSKGRLNPYTKHLKRIFYDACFPTIEDLALVLMNKIHSNSSKIVYMQDFRNPSINNTIDCYNVGQKTLSGKGHLMQNAHLFYNFNFYARESTIKYPDKEVLIVRTEHLWDDIDSLNLALAETLVKYGAVYNATILHDRNKTASKLTFSNLTEHIASHGSEGYKVKSGLSKEGKEILCCHLSEDNQVFEDIVRFAVNIGDDEKESYLNLLYDDCGISKSERKIYNHQVVDEEMALKKCIHFFLGLSGQMKRDVICNVTIS